MGDEHRVVFGGRVPAGPEETSRAGCDAVALEIERGVDGLSLLARAFACLAPNDASGRNILSARIERARMRQKRLRAGIVGGAQRGTRFVEIASQSGWLDTAPRFQRAEEAESSRLQGPVHDVEPLRLELRCVLEGNDERVIAEAGVREPKLRVGREGLARASKTRNADAE